MLKSIRIRDFQSHEETFLPELGGITTITGASRAGKSAVVRAIRAAVANQTGASFIRHGAKAAQVELTFDDGSVLRWEKSAGAGGTYTVERPGEAPVFITRAGRDREQPPELAAFGIREFEADGLRTWLQIDGQFDAPFLLSATGGQTAKLLAKVSRLDVLTSAQVLAHRDADRARRDANAADADVERLSEELATQPDYEALLVVWRDLAEREKAAQSRLQQLATAERLLERRRVLADYLAEWEGLELPGRINGLVGLVETLEKADRLLRRQSDLAVLMEEWRTRELPARIALVLSKIEQLEAAARLVVRCAAAREEAEKAEAALSVARTEAEAIDTRLHDLLDGLDVCPVCGTVLAREEEFVG